MEINRNARTLGPHLTFDEQALAGQDAYPCMCWQAGRGDITGIYATDCQHPDEWYAGAEAAYEEAYDI
jgi:hypothetical protein